MVLVAVLVVGLASFAVYRLQGAFGSQDTTATPAVPPTTIVPFQPQERRARGVPGTRTTATITYLDVDARPQRVDGTALPWRYEDSTTTPPS